MKKPAMNNPNQLHIESGTWVATSRAERLLGCSKPSIIRYIDRGLLIGKRVPPKGWYKIEYESILVLIRKMEQEAREPGSTDLYRHTNNR